MPFRPHGVHRSFAGIALHFLSSAKRARATDAAKTVEARCDPTYSPPLFRGVLAQLVRAPPCHGGGCGFEPRRLRNYFSTGACSLFCAEVFLETYSPVGPIGPVNPVAPVTPFAAPGPIRSIRKDAFTGLFSSTGSVTEPLPGVTLLSVTTSPAANEAVSNPFTETVALVELVDAALELKVAIVGIGGAKTLEYLHPGISVPLTRTSKTITPVGSDPCGPVIGCDVPRT